MPRRVMIVDDDALLVLHGVWLDWQAATVTMAATVTVTNPGGGAQRCRGGDSTRGVHCRGNAHDEVMRIESSLALCMRACDGDVASQRVCGAVVVQLRWRRFCTRLP